MKTKAEDKGKKVSYTELSREICPAKHKYCNNSAAMLRLQLMAVPNLKNETLCIKGMGLQWHTLL